MMTSRVRATCLRRSPVSFLCPHVGAQSSTQGPWGSSILRGSPYPEGVPWPVYHSNQMWAGSESHITDDRAQDTAEAWDGCLQGGPAEKLRGSKAWGQLAPSLTERLPEISHESLGSSQCLLEYLLNRLHSGSGRVKLKVRL